MPDSSFQYLLWTAGIYASYGLVILWGIILCYRRGDRRPHGLKWARAAIATLVGGTVGTWLLNSRISFVGQNQPISTMLFQWAMFALYQLPTPISIGMLFWGIFGDVEPREESDNEPPVFRYDDGTEARK